ncbi:MAG: Glu-tRNA(Gln) amidotransferase subunit GatE [Candidatus Pacearchaeota archaeon]
MTEELDYKELGVKSGLEIHQQLDTEKLFCSCPSVLRSDNPDFTFKRKLHAIAGESGEVDEAVKHEASFDREFIYQGYNDSTCLIELDEEPPHMINNESLKIAIQIALLLNCEILPVTQIMRKTVIDGSNTGGFQRTVLIAQNGWIETSLGKVGIQTIGLEEDAARTIEKSGNSVVYRLDRLGIPLVEIATSPDMSSPEQIKEVALQIGDILRSCKVKRGIGTIRQDINLSIKKHPRVEIKGFQDLKMFVPTINYEIKRQIENKNAKSEVRRATPEGGTEFMRPMPGSARMYPETDLPLLKISRDFINEIKHTLPQLRSDVRKELGKQGLNDELINLLLKEGKLEEFKSLLNIIPDTNLIAKMLVLWPKNFSTKTDISIEEIKERVSLDVIEIILNELKKEKITKNDIPDILLEVAKGKSVKEAISVEKVSSDELETFVIKLIKEKPGLTAGGYMGIIMAKFKGKASGKEIMDILKKHAK